MIIDSHCHAWARWPYRPPVPDEGSRGRVEQLLYEMDLNSVDQALVVCARIDHNLDNNDYVAAAVASHPDRLHMLADVDSMWLTTHHQPGAAARLEAAANRWPVKGFTHYMKFEDDGSWLLSAEGAAFFETAVRRRLIASIHCHPHHQAAIQEVATRFPRLPLLIHHLGHPKVGDLAGLELILASARYENIYLKLSGFYYATAQEPWDFPFADVQQLVRAQYEHFGPERLCWGSDYPVCRRSITYRQALEQFRARCDFVPTAEHKAILGGNLARLLDTPREV